MTETARNPSLLEGIGRVLLFLMPTTLLFHAELGNPQERIHLFKNLSIIGGLLLVIDRHPR